MIMGNIENILNELAAKLLTEGSVEFSENGLNIKASYNNGNFCIESSYVSPVEDETNKLVKSFEEYVKSLSDEFFLEVVESFEDGQLKKIQDKVDSKNPKLVKEGISEFMHNLKKVAAFKVLNLNTDIEAAEKELNELIEIRDSYNHVLNKTF